MQSLCTLRHHCHQWLRNTRYQADATPYLGRTSTGWIAPACGWRTHLITSSAAIRGTKRYGIWTRTAISVRLDVGRPDHLAPFLGVVGDELAKVGGREREHVATEIGKPRPYLEIGEARIDLFVELRDDLSRRILGCAEAIPLGAS